jgi:methyl-accepting chemotaxis protein
MLQRVQQLGLQLIILGSFFLVLLGGMAVGATLVPREVHRTLLNDLIDRGNSFLGSVAAQGVALLQDTHPDGMRMLLSRTHKETLQNELDAAVVLTPAKDNPGQPDADNLLAQELNTSEAAQQEGSAVARLTAVLEHLKHNPTSFSFTVDSHPVLVKPIIASVTSSAGTTEKTLGYVLVVLHPGEVNEKVAEFRKELLEAFALFGILFMGVVFVTTQLFVLRPLAQMRELASRISEGELTSRVANTGPDELGVTAEALNKIAESLNRTLGKVKDVSDGISSVMASVSRSGEVVSRGAVATQDSVRETRGSMEAMMSSLRGIASNVEVLERAVQESSSSILQMAATNDAVFESIAALVLRVEETAGTIEQMDYSIKEVSRSVEDLSASTDETSSSMNEMDVSIGQVEMNANETSKLAELVSADAQSGVGALQKTLAGIEKIKDSSQTAAQVIESLGKKTEAIGKILNVIDDVAEQTNLLALNAAIIAAQAGEHGKGFAVVADEIKGLAERTGDSTKEIAELIRSLQDESRNAVNAMERGVKSVDEGVRLGTEAEGALKKILESSSKASQMVKAIARATVEQSRGSKQVTNSINKIAEAMQQIRKATSDQEKNSSTVMVGAENMKMLTKQVERSSQEQSRVSKAITKAIENINEMTIQLSRAQKEETKRSENVLGAM